MTARFQQLGPTEFSAAMREARKPVVVDVRGAEAYTTGHVPGSLHIGVHDLGRRRAELPGSFAERVLIVSDTAKRAVAAANFLSLIGFGDVGVLVGGIEAYAGPLEQGPPPPPRAPGPDLNVVPD